MLETVSWSWCYCLPFLKGKRVSFWNFCRNKLSRVHKLHVIFVFFIVARFICYFGASTTQRIYISFSQKNTSCILKDSWRKIILFIFLVTMRMLEIWIKGMYMIMAIGRFRKLLLFWFLLLHTLMIAFILRDYKLLNWNC